jgi:DNA polymerase-3 subunit epsilon
MKFLILDTEGSGLFDYSKPADAEGQPRLAQITAFEADTDDLESVAALATAVPVFNYYVLPEGWEMHPDATAINGLTTEFLRENGSPVAAALQWYSEMIAAGFAVAAFNSRHDVKQLRSELRRAGMPDLFEQTANVCLMRACGGLGIEKANGKKGWPGLADVCRHLGIENAEPHKASGDARAAAAIFGWLHSHGKLPAPEVHYAKNRPEAA